MNKTNVFCSSGFYMAEGDVLNILIIDETGTPVTIELSTDENKPPDPPTALPATDITSSSFTANWMFNENSAGYFLDVARDIDFTDMVIGWGNKDMGDTNSESITGLDEGVPYFYRIRAYNDYGTSADSNIITVITVMNIALYNWYAVNKSIETGNKSVYGALYNWHAVNTGKLAPAGCYIPTFDEILTLCTTIGGNAGNGGKLKQTGVIDWNGPNTGADNSTGFTGLGGGYRVNTGVFGSLKNNMFFWCSDLAGSNPYVIGLTYNDANVFLGSWSANHGCSARCLLDDPGSWYGGMTITDIDGNIYHTVQIGTQVWLVENLKVEHYNDGTSIPNITDNDLWAADTAGAMCYYDNTPSLLLPLFAPTGWHVPTSTEFNAMLTFLGNSNLRGGYLKEAGYAHWNPPNTGADNSSGFTAFGSGYRRSDGVYFQLKTFAGYYTSDEYDGNIGYMLQLESINAIGEVQVTGKGEGRSVRLIKDDSTDPGTVTDIDGNIYATVKINDQVYMAEDIKVTHYNDGSDIPLLDVNNDWLHDVTGAMCYYNNIAP